MFVITSYAQHTIRRAVLLCALLCALLPIASHAQTSLSKQDSFIELAFTDNVPAVKTLWLDKAQKKSAKKILGHEYQALRVRYWQEGNKTVWVLNEIGKYKPITVGVVIVGGKIDKLTVLAYRESHGWEVKHDFFTQQFIGAHLNEKKKLTEKIDGISGATLSVRALKKLARLSLYFDTQVENHEL